MRAAGQGGISGWRRGRGWLGNALFGARTGAGFCEAKAILAASSRQNRGALPCEKGKLDKTVRAPSGLKRALKFAICGLFGDFGGVEPPKSRNRTRKSFSGGFSGAVPFNSSVYRLTAPPQSKAGSAICAFLSVFGFGYRGKLAICGLFGVRTGAGFCEARAILAASSRQNRGALPCEKGKLDKTVRAPSGLKRALKFAICGLFGDFGGVEPPKTLGENS